MHTNYTVSAHQFSKSVWWCS